MKSAMQFGVVLILLTSGCLQNQGDDPLDDEPVQALEFNIALADPIVVNATETKDGLWHRLVFRECPFPETLPPEIQVIKVWDRYGLVSEEVVDVDTSLTEQWFWIPLHGEPPWVVAGDDYPCSYIQRNMLYNITDGYNMSSRLCSWSPGCLDKNDARTFYNISFELPIGSMRSEYPWEASDYSWKAEGGFPVIDENRSGFGGTISLFYPNGELWREDRFPLTGGRSANFTPLLAILGVHKIAVEADFPHAMQLEGRYELLYYEFDEQVCALGFEWEIC